MWEDGRTDWALTFITIVAPLGNTASLFVLDPCRQTCRAQPILCTCTAALGTRHALLSLLVRVEAGGAAVQALALVREASRFTCYTLRLRRSVARPA